jgi:acetyltransferase-like isoleucine patch superfamily enzyme
MADIYVHPTAIVETEPDAIGSGTRVWAFSHLMRGIQVGAHCNIGEHCFIETGAILGNRVTLKNGNMVWEGITLEDGVFVGPQVVLTNDRNPRSPRLPEAQPRYQTRAWLKRTLIQYGASIGAGAIILPGVRIGRFALVGAGAVVTRDVPAYTLVLGMPAVVAGWVCECGLSLQLDASRAVCNGCNREYFYDGRTLVCSAGMVG